MTTAWTVIERDSLRDEAALVAELIAAAGVDAGQRARITVAGADLVRRIRASVKPGLMEVFLAEYGLSTDEGIALMCLAEALLRVPDADTMDALIEDKIAPSDWGRHLGKSASSLVNASTWALMLTGKVLDEREPGVVGHLKAAVKRLGEPVIRTAVTRAMKEMGRNFVLGETIDLAMKRARELEAQGYTYSYDMLGEAARTEADARRYHLSYSAAITAIARAATTGDIRTNPGISVKLSALHPRYEVAKRGRVMEELVPRVRALAGLAKAAGLGFNIDAEEADRLALSLEVIEAVLSDPALRGWDGFGVVVQAYGRRAGAVIDWLYALSVKLDRKIMVRLVKGAYWDAEVKRAQVLGLTSFPVFTRKQATDVSYIANARKLLGLTDRIYPQFATHNAHTVAAILDMATDKKAFEFQRLHGMGERLHDIVLTDNGTRCRIYAPVGAHRDLLAYLVRRLLENGANSSFVNQIVNEEVSPERVAACPITAMEGMASVVSAAIATGPALFGGRVNSQGWDLTDAGDLAAIAAARGPHEAAVFEAGPMLAGARVGGLRLEVKNPATGALVGHVLTASVADVDTALRLAEPWAASALVRAEVLRRAADLYEANFGPIFAILAREAGKSLADAVAELREAVDFMRYYADGAEALTAPARGVFACISPWNFPLAIFSGQIGAALAGGNAVVAKPAEQTPLIAALAVDLLHKAGVPASALQLLPGDGQVGAAITRNARVNGVAFTGSTETALMIRRAMAEHLDPTAPLIAETGGLNAMLVDSTALPEQAVRDILASSFQSAGQRCSALRCLYVQEDVAETVQEMLFGAMDELALGDPLDLFTDVGPVIDAEAQQGIADYVAAARAEGRVLKEMTAPKAGTFIAPTVIKVAGIAAMPKEIFGPVLHIATFKAGQVDKVVQAVNATGYGLTFGLHTRIDDRVQAVIEALHVGNTYVNRNQIGAVVGSQPFGGEGLSGTGPKAGGPEYLHRFTVLAAPAAGEDSREMPEAEVTAQLRLDRKLAHPVQARVLPGPTGESNRLTASPRAPLLCLGPGAATALAQAEAVRALGGHAVEASGLAPLALARLDGFSGALWWGDVDGGRERAKALAARKGPILPLIGGMPDAGHALLERHVCIDTTASGGNAQLLAEVSAA
ncbi:MAG: proline dehydrogenase / delta 1-pyrroline-5-carboxylate dehydrogenase [Rhodobacteraceae bacterium]|uniref:bifunctional proline dehydrogenase/L-glutamate gamma-semialdehyde dehydrogenase PutA n=1 Tax=Cypionkella sp. TaxID=2811411 RepID=UPI0013211755|nr:bifunctional proline dehydrogenase/L-glutamate gamma-semialdehyde dehydrogenase PutA [Cypionkella sp.]KAF0173803.1 MAG: proline dehydrogenase / delta 1-pyrroline-5-carboxylate dehydrogenase [Paracoccaceae bacterium]MDO8326795.1 bifunctional proline dehydrogenase/L-glutamate gamma-semialdehyde dehydrogenase PutA [Cypionkella sp.]